MHLIHTIHTLSKFAGGPSRTVTSLCSELAYLDNEVEILTADKQSISKNNAVFPYNKKVKVFSIMLSNLIYEKYLARNYYKLIRSRLNYSKEEIIHDHGVWLPSNLASTKIARLNHVPFVISPRGMLEPWALEKKKIKKKLAWLLYQNRNLNKAKLIHATSDQEAQNLRNLGITQPISIIPNGVNLNVPTFNELKNYKNRKHKLHSKRTLLFLSRIHPIKGLLNLVEAWRIVKPNDWKVIIAGPDENNHKLEVIEKLKTLGIYNDFEFVGFANEKQKLKLYKKADLFILPTHSENFGVVIAEALSMGVPCITTKNAPWESLLKYDCGWWIDVGVESLVNVLKVALTTPREKLNQMGKNGYIYSNNNYQWGKISSKMQDTYNWLLGKGNRPSFVYFA